MPRPEKQASASIALSALIPIPGPFGMVFGSAMAIVALQHAVGAGSLWLPSFLRNCRISASAFAALQRYADPIVSRIERIIRTNAVADRSRPALHPGAPRLCSGGRDCSSHPVWQYRSGHRGVRDSGWADRERRLHWG
ncbi:exopolysaccharide biosynthesis protein (plasmid) [Rhizobium sp. TH2]|nr:exopolysaccharide biosynthesis protein [Rhizobium sp. TH2]